ncbi:MAG: LacI family DNA-binding transcriptional regulator, partial [Clostridiaceae bacterium]|nr:LacI family DNA-binding transcriptional regulator [Clostridiaceae bacterium]
MPTLKDVAQKAGVTVTTVSRVINNRGYLSEETKQKVKQAMDELHYRPNELARSLSKQNTNTIGVIT